MLTFKKANCKGATPITSSFTISKDGTILVVTRTIDNKGKTLMVKLDNKVSTLNAKVLELTMMSNDDFAMFSDILVNTNEGVENV